jgi:ankyrin repeat protein
LMFAAMFNRLDMVKLLLSRQVHIVDTRSSDGLCALDLARRWAPSTLRPILSRRCNARPMA